MSTNILTQSESYSETLTVNRVDALPDSFELLIQSNLSHSRDPNAWQVRHRVIVSAATLAELGRALQAAAR